MNQLLIQSVGEFRGDFPDIPLEENLLSRIKENDPTPHFFTLPIGKIGAASRNMGRKITRRDVELIVSEVNAKRPEGRIGKGHLKPEERAKSLQDAQWLAAVIDGDTAWGKFYVYPRAKDEYQVLSTQAAANARAGTSVYGSATRGVAGDGWEGLDLSAIDISTYPEAVSQLENMAVPILTSEFEDSSRGDDHTDNEQKEQDSMDEKLIVQELHSAREERDTFRDEAKDAQQQVAELTTNIAELTTERDALQTTLTSLELGDKPTEAIAELRTNAAVAQAVAEAITEHASAFEGLKTDTPAALIAELATALADTRVKALDGDITDLIAEMVPVEDARPFIQDRVTLLRESGKVTDKATAQAEIKAYMETDAYKKLAGSLVSEMFGGRVIVGGTGGDDAVKHGFVTYEESVKMAQGEQ